MMNVPYFTLPDTELFPGVASTDQLRLRDSEVVGRLGLLRVPFWIKLLTCSQVVITFCYREQSVIGHLYAGSLDPRAIMHLVQSHSLGAG